MRIDELNMHGQCGRYCPVCAADLGSLTPTTDPEHGLSEVDCPTCGTPAALGELLGVRPEVLGLLWDRVGEAEYALAESRRQNQALLAELRSLQQTIDSVRGILAERGDEHSAETVARLVSAVLMGVGRA